MGDELNRFTTNFSDILQQQSHQIQERINAFSTALERFSDRLSGIISSLSGEASAGNAPAMVGGVQLVRVINDQAQPIPVRVLEGAREESRGGGFFSSIFGGIGSFFGGIVGGILAPFTGVAVGAELIVASAELGVVVNDAVNLVREVKGLVAGVKDFGLEFVKSIRGLVLLLFEEFHSAGIFPVSSLIASLLIFIDSGITLILTHIEPIINWVTQLLETLTTWLGNFINALTRWLDGVINSLRLAVHNIVRDTIRSLVESLTAVISGFLVAFNRVIVESFTWGGQWIAYSIATMLNKIPGVDIETKRPEPLGERVSRAMREAFREGREIGRTAAEELLGPAPGRATERATPGFRTPPLKLPEMPSPEPALGRIIEAPQRRPSLPPGITSTERPGVPEAPPPITINGGVNVHITAQTIDRENAEETARLIAENVLNEIQRLTERDRFSRGLSTAAII